MISTSALKEMTLFSQMPEDDLVRLQSALRPRQLAAGEVLFNMGDPGDELIIVQAGQVAIYAPLPGSPVEGQAIRIFESGQVLGEMALIDRKPRSLSARAETASTILTLKGADFHSLLADSPEMVNSIMAGLSDRIRYTTDFLSEVRVWVRRIAEGNYTAPLGSAGSTGYRDSTLETLAAEFAQMASQVRQREETLRAEVAQLRIEIDDAKRKRDAAQIMGSDYYKSLKEKAAALRQQRDE